MSSSSVSLFYLLSPDDQDARLDQAIDLGLRIAVLGQNRQTVLAFGGRDRSPVAILERRHADDVRQRNRFRNLWMMRPGNGAARRHMRMLKERGIGVERF